MYLPKQTQESVFPCASISTFTPLSITPIHENRGCFDGAKFGALSLEKFQFLNLFRYKLLLAILLSCALHGVAIHIYNDSPYTLHAKIYSVLGRELTDIVISSGHSMTYQESLFDARDYALGPFKVVFTCPNGDRYGTVSNISSSFTVHARSSRGPKKCHSSSQPFPHRDHFYNPPHHRN